MSGKSGKGGAREGSGRKNKYGRGRKTRHLSINFPQDIIDKLDAKAEKQEVSRSEIVVALVEKGMKR
tara:strand:- start:1489 stop:1689 length:201 start_codon:yes stop_codon:yes gene_type:complete